ncbi:hypothetical protein AHF37_11378, partial [Paragonimus kellicotti]
IKSAVFWGRDHILSGSECGHVIAWNRWSGAPVCAIKADSSVVNRIAPHPSLPLSPFELLTDEYVAKVLASTARARQQMIYRGRRSCRTVVRSVNPIVQSYICLPYESNGLLSSVLPSFLFYM